MKRSTTSAGARLPDSIFSLASRIEEPGFQDVRELYRLQSIPAVRMVFDEAGWSDAVLVFGDDREAIEQQTLVFVQSRHLLQEAVFNPLRGQRTGTRPSADAAGWVDRELREKGCRWCDEEGWHVSNDRRLQDGVGNVLSATADFAPDRTGRTWLR
jgi:hypothetical protein